ncbi:MAG: TetR/AcrR family transcriptional regulator [Candidatus Dormibacteraeota bacterium]|nr:TetR/AcrR family transcriptional regulator [Candidatus Dormibacteraeota bacterium]
METVSREAGGETRQQRSSARSQERRRRLLAAALEILAERGYNETSVDQVVAQARTSKTAFYEFFDSKEDCVRDLLETEGGALIHRVTSAAAQGVGHRDRMRRGIRAFVTACGEQRALARVLLVESVGISQRIESVRQELQGRFAAVVEDEVRRAGADHDPFYAAMDPVVFGRAVVGAVNDATAHLLKGSGENRDALADGLCRIFAP